MSSFDVTCDVLYCTPSRDQKIPFPQHTKNESPEVRGANAGTSALVCQLSQQAQSPTYKFLATLCTLQQYDGADADWIELLFTLKIAVPQKNYLESICAKFSFEKDKR